MKIPRITALLVIDVQQSFRQRPYFDERGIESFFERLQLSQRASRTSTCR